MGFSEQGQGCASSEYCVLISVSMSKIEELSSNDIAITELVMLGRGDIIDACSFNLNFQLVQTLKC